MTMPELASAAELAAQAGKPYPNDSAEYRRARTALLAEEIELRRHIERVAAQRRALPLVAKPLPTSSPTRAARRWRSPICSASTTPSSPTSGCSARNASGRVPCARRFLGSIDIPSVDIAQRVALAVIGRSPVERQLAFARERGWRNLKFYATVGDDFARDYRGLAPDGSEWPALDVWVKDGTRVRHFWGAELAGTADPGQDPRASPDPVPLWNILDLTPAGRGTDWYPKLDYE